MIRTIFVPLEISNSDENVIKYAIEIAGHFQSRLVFFKSYFLAEYAYPSGVAAGIPPVRQDFVNEEKEMKEEKLDYLVSNFPALSNLEFELKIKAGSSVDLVYDIAGETQADLIVIGTNGATGIEELFGTIAEKLTREASCPVLVIPDDFHYRAVKKIGMAVDTDNLKNDLHLDTLFDFTRNLQATLDFVNVSESIDKADMNHNNIYQRIKEEFDDNVNYYSIRILLKDGEEKALTEYIDRNQIDLLAIVYREHGFFARIFKPGLRKKLVFHSDIPLLVLK